MKLLLVLSLLVLLPGAVLAENDPFERGKVIDLTYPFDAQTIFWPTEKGFQLESEHDGMTEKGYYYAANRFCTAEHGGTHVDAPRHFGKGKPPVDEIPLERLIARGVVVDVSRKTGRDEDEDYRIAVDDFTDWEKSHGRIPDKAIVLLRTGWGKHWKNRKKYLGTDEKGAAAVAKLHFPGLHPDAARWLVEERKIAAVGIDTASIDTGQSKEYETHRVLGEHEVPAFENVANLDLLPEKDLTVIALPMKIRGGSGGPLRIVAVIHEI
jgi:kynurenine formamidase